MQMFNSTSDRHKRLMMANNLSAYLAWLSGAEWSDPLQGSAILQRGIGVPYFTRATTRTVKDWEGVVCNCLSGELAFEGFRRVRNLVHSDLSGAYWNKLNTGTGVTPVITAGQTAPDGTASAYRMQLDCGGGLTSGDQSYVSAIVFGTALTTGASLRPSAWIKSNTGSNQTILLRGGQNNETVVVTTEWQRLSTAVSNWVSVYMLFALRGDLTPQTADVLVWQPQLEDATGQSNQNPAEYVSVGDTTTPANLRTYSQELATISAAAWSSTDMTLTANYANNSQGLPIAVRVVEGVAGTAAFTDGTALTGLPAGYRGTIAWEFKRNAVNDWVFIRLSDNVANHGVRAWFNINTGVKGSVALFGSATLGDSTMTDLGNGWYRCTATCTMPAAATILRTAFCSAAGDGNTTRVNNSDYSISRAQENVGDPRAYEAVGNVHPFHGAFVDGVKYFPNENGNTVASNVVTEATGPAIAASTLKGARINRASTNLDLYSQLASNAAWTKTDTTVTSETNTAPDGTATAALLTEGVAGTAQVLGTAARTITANGFASISRFFKYGNTPWVRLRFYDTGASANTVQGWFNIQTGVVGSATNGGTATDAAVAIEAFDDGWYRCTLIGKINNAATAVGVVDSSASADGSTTRVNNATRYWWGAQFENRYGSTDYIPTTSAAVTRNAEDFDYRDTPDFGAKGMMYCEVTPDWATNNLGTSSNILSIDTDVNERTCLETPDTTSGARLLVVDGGVSQVAQTAPAAFSNRTLAKVAAYYETNRANGAMNGALATIDTACTMPTTNRVSIMKRAASTAQNMDGCIKNIYISRVPVSNTQIASATT